MNITYGIKKKKPWVYCKEMNNIQSNPLINVGKAFRQMSHNYYLWFDITELILVTGLNKIGHAFKVSAHSICQ